MLKGTILYATAIAIASGVSRASMSASQSSSSISKLLLSNQGNIFIAEFNGSTFHLVYRKQVSGNPTWMALVKPDLLYAVDEDSTKLQLLHINLGQNNIEESKSTHGSKGVVHLEFTRNRNRMVGAAYGSGSVDVFDSKDGGLRFMKTIVSKDHLGPNKSRQDMPHPHQTVIDPSGRFFAVNDLGTDHVLLIDSQNDAFSVVNHVPVSRPGCGPRHGVFFPAGQGTATHYILLCEMGNLVIVFSLTYGGHKGIEFKWEQTISSFGSEAAMPASAAAGELVLTPDNKHIYASNRLCGQDTDSIAHFRVMGQDKGGIRLEFAGLTSSGGRLPRMFSLSSDSSHLFVANQGGALGLVALKRKNDGTLDEQPVASIAMDMFGGKAGPAYVQQIV